MVSVCMQEIVTLKILISDLILFITMKIEFKWTVSNYQHYESLVVHKSMQ